MTAVKTITLILFATAFLFVTGCSDKTQPAAQKQTTQKPSEVSQAAPAAESHASSQPPQAAVASCQVLLSDADRPPADRARDGGRKPAQVLKFLGLKPGMTAIDLIAAGGYYTEVLSRCVGPTGTVYAQNPLAVLKYRDGANDKAMTTRLADGRLSNVVRRDRNFDNLGIEPDSVDFAITALNFHDVYNGAGSAAVQGMLAAVKDSLKPGGILGIVDHVGVAGADNKKLHRIEPGLVRQEVLKAGFLIDGESDILSNPEDPHEARVFAEGLRGKTDRFLFRLKKS